MTYVCSSLRIVGSEDCGTSDIGRATEVPLVDCYLRLEAMLVAEAERSFVLEHRRHVV